MELKMQERKPWSAKIKSGLIHRLGIASVIDFARKKSVPVHKHSLWYYLGGIILTLFVIQVVTGFLLLFYYKPTPEEAHESIVRIMREVPYGWLIRSIHSWSASLMIGILFLHLFSSMIMKAYRQPREITWISGMLLLILSLALGFSGYLLPWTELSFFATKVGTGLAKKVPIVGNYIFYLLRGTENISGDTLMRFFGLHVCILPLGLGIILAVHIWLIQAHGMSVPISIEQQKKKLALEPFTEPVLEHSEGFEGKLREGMPFFPSFFYRDIVSAIVVLGIVVTLSVFLPKEIGNKADPLAPAPEGIRPEWFFVFLFQTLKYLPSKILFIDGELFGLFIIGLGVVFLFLVPFLDRKSHRGEREKLFTAVAIFLLVYIFVFTILGYIPTGAENILAIQNPENTVTVEEANVNESHPTLAQNRILGLIGFWSILLFIIVFLMLKIRHYDQLAEQGYYNLLRC
ncbi:TPA: cytochrome bc complex cytochrome b subunit [Candidatus Poribacteria bacterium]|nr:cytochrome bc complex cytochrome b subunit [Candidatus Poribacteria bacterium]